jgi:hypothetical protein
MSRGSILAVAACFLSTGLLVQAQTPDNAVHAPDGGAQEKIDSISIPPLTNAPFQATVTLQWTRHLANGSTLVVRNHRLVVRDSQGNIYQERRTFVPDGSDKEAQIRRIEISNPLKHTKYFCNAALTQCTLRNYFPEDMVRAVTPQANTAAASSSANISATAQRRRRPPKAIAANSEVIHTTLGTRSIEGLDAVGTKDTRIIPPGAGGNSTPLESSKEFWYSPQLGLNLRVLRIDPLHGDQSFKVTDVSLTEPDPQRFVLPPTCKVRDMRRGVHSDASAPAADN